MKESVFSKIDLDDYLTKDMGYIPTAPIAEHQISRPQFIPNVIAIEFCPESKPAEGEGTAGKSQPALYEPQEHSKLPLSEDKSRQFSIKKGSYDESKNLSYLRLPLSHSYNGYLHLETFHSVFVTGEKWSFKNLFNRLFNG